MSILGTNRQRINHARRGAIGLAAVSLLCVGITNLYAVFGHGIRSDAMDYMFLYPLCGGAVMLLLDVLLRRLCGCGLSRISRNLMHSGIAALTAGAMLRGILYIAGGSSPYAGVFPAVGWALAVAGVATGACGVLRSR